MAAAKAKAAKAAELAAAAQAVDAGAKCPIDHSKMSSSGGGGWIAPPPRTDAKGCPIDGHGTAEGPAGFAGVFGGNLSPVNNIPVGLSATERAPGQTYDLSTERTLSGIPRPKEEGEAPVWEYPSPQQFYNALVRKGWETPEDSIQMVVDIHNWINEGGWDQIMRWEQRMPG
jgi:cytochrome c heme-lyase